MNDDQIDELEAIRAIFVEDVEIESDCPVSLLFNLLPSDEEAEFASDMPELHLRLAWPDEYPMDAPLVATVLNDFEESVKHRIRASIEACCEENAGMAMTYMVVEHVKDHFMEYGIPPKSIASRAKLEARESLWVQAGDSVAASANSKAAAADVETAGLHSVSTGDRPKTGFAAAAEAGRGMTKGAKRRMYDRLAVGGELARGHDWVDVINHLRKTGGGRTDEG
jgi:hypothetical protein